VGLSFIQALRLVCPLCMGGGSRGAGVCFSHSQHPLGWQLQVHQGVATTLEPVAHTCNPSYSRGRDQEDRGSKPAWANSSVRPYLKKRFTKIGLLEWLKVKAMSSNPSTTHTHTHTHTKPRCGYLEARAQLPGPGAVSRWKEDSLGPAPVQSRPGVVQPSQPPSQASAPHGPLPPPAPLALFIFSAGSELPRETSTLAPSPVLGEGDPESMKEQRSLLPAGSSHL
jgi:hypothetical protein